MADISAKDAICKRLRALGFTQSQTLPIVDLWSKWVNSSGEEWTCQRLKALKTWFVNTSTGNAKGNKPEWISFHGDNTPKGPFRRLFVGVDLTDRKLHKRTQRSLNALMVYTASVSKEVTPSQAKKFVNSVEKPSTFDVLSPDNADLLFRIDRELRPIARAVAQHYKHVRLDHPETWMERVKSSPLPPFYGSRSVKYLYETDDDDNVKVGPNGRPIKRTHQDVAFNGVMHRHIQDLLFAWLVNRDDAYKVHTENQKASRAVRTRRFDDACEYGMYLRSIKSTYCGRVKDWVGNIGFIQEPGYKLRTVANVHPVLQGMTSQLAKALWATLREDIPEDAAFDQSKAVQDGQRWLQHGQRLYSIDLSSATDNFPWVIQERLLRLVSDVLSGPGNEEIKQLWDGDCEVVKAIARGGYWIPNDNTLHFLDDYRSRDNKGKAIHWKTGQPLGAYFSFALFSLCHHALVRASKPDFYRILGDDLVVDETCGRRHLSALEQVGIPISKEKSISGECAEFAGKLFHAYGQFVQLKCRHVSDSSFIEAARLLGPKSIGMFRPRQKKILKILDVLLPSDYPIALGWNTKGLSYQTRSELTRKWLEATGSRVDLNKVSIRTGYIAQLMRLSTYVNKKDYDLFIRDWVSLTRVKEIPGTNIPKNDKEGYVLRADQPINPRQDTLALMESIRRCVEDTDQLFAQLSNYPPLRSGNSCKATLGSLGESEVVPKDVTSNPYETKVEQGRADEPQAIAKPKISYRPRRR